MSSRQFFPLIWLYKLCQYKPGWLFIDPDSPMSVLSIASLWHLTHDQASTFRNN